MVGKGRPPTGTRVDVRIPAEQLERIDALAVEEGKSRAEMLREIIADWLIEHGP